jgi:hypothetical protein
MDGMEIEIFETSFYEVFAAIVLAMDGDTEITDGQFIYQSLKGNRSEGEEQTPSTSTVDLKFFGRCRYCTNDKFVEVVDDIISDPMTLTAFQDRLKDLGINENTKYFENIVAVTYSEPEFPESLPPIEDESLYDSTPPSTSIKHPWALYLIVFMSIVIIGTGIYVVHRDQNAFMKQELSTDEEDSSNDEEYSEDEESSVDDDDAEDDESEVGETLFSKDENNSTLLSYAEDAPTVVDAQNNDYEVYMY